MSIMDMNSLHLCTGKQSRRKWEFFRLVRSLSVFNTEVMHACMKAIGDRLRDYDCEKELIHICTLVECRDWL